jgi:hypothetical protein
VQNENLIHFAHCLLTRIEADSAFGLAMPKSTNFFQKYFRLYLIHYQYDKKYFSKDGIQLAISLYIYYKRRDEELQISNYEQSQRS